MMSYSNSLPFREAGGLISFTVIGWQDYDPPLASPHRHHRFSAAFGRGDSRFTQSLLLQLASVEALQVGIPSHGVYGGLAPEKAQEWIALFAQPTEPLPTSAGIFAGDHPHVAH